jgi:methionyl-tRNA formyltransferase
MALKPSPVQAMAERFAIPIFTPKSLKSLEIQQKFQSHDADVAVVVAYGLLLPQAILDMPREGCINLHASLLPRWRGAAPLQRAIMAGDTHTGVAVMRMEAGLDTGPVGMVERLSITPDMTSGELHDRLRVFGADLMARALAALSRGSLQFIPQLDDGVTYAAKITNDNARIDWSLSAEHIHNLIRGLSPLPGAYTFADFGKGSERIKVLRSQHIENHFIPSEARAGAILDETGVVVCGDDTHKSAIRLLQVQRAGKAAMSFNDFMRGVGSAFTGRFIPA